MKKRELPDGWEWKNLREVALKYINGGTPSTAIPEYWSGTIPWTTSKSITSCTLNAGEKFISEKAVENSSSNIIPKNNVLVATRVGIGKSAVNLIDIAISQDITGIMLDKNIIIPEYLVWYLHNKEVKKKLESSARGTTIKGLQRSDLERIDIPLPPLPFQRRIVEILDQADALRRFRAQADAETQKLLQSVFYEMFGNPVRNEKGWEVARLNELCNTTTGGTPSRDNPLFYKGSIPWLKSGELNNSIINSAEESISNDALEKSSTKIIPKGTILIALYGATVGKVGILGINAAINQAICAIFIKKSLNVEYLSNLLILNRESLLKKRAGGAQPNISQEIINNIIVPIPPIALQQHFAIFVQEVRQIRETQARLNQETEGLFDGLMMRAFAGELI